MWTLRKLSKCRQLEASLLHQLGKGALNLQPIDLYPPPLLQGSCTLNHSAVTSVELPGEAA